MNLYLLDRTTEAIYMQFSAVIVVAPDEDTARNMSPMTGLPMDWNDHIATREWVYGAAEVEVIHLGTPVTETPGIVRAFYVSD